MRLDKFFTQTATCSRSDAGKKIRRGDVCVNGQAVRDPSIHIDPENDVITLCGAVVSYVKGYYIMMNKPTGVVCATEDGDTTVIDLLPDNLRRKDLFPCGRLDKNTTGFVLITDDGPLAHTLLAPKSHVEKTYYFETKFPYSDEDIEKLCSGVDIGDYVTKPCKVIRISEKSGKITICEGKFHQIKFMFIAVHNQITALSRTAFGGIELDCSLKLGEFRYLTDDELVKLRSSCNNRSNKLEY